MKHEKLNTNITVNILVCIVILPFVFVSCSGANPVIYKLDWTLQVNAHPLAMHKSIEKLILHVLADDEDGFEELYELYVIQSESELYWHVTSEEWSEFVSNEKTWIGINALKTEDERYLPRGEYRVLLRDLSGYEDEKKFTLSSQMIQYTSEVLPVMRINKDGIYIPYFRSAAKNTQVEIEKIFGFLQIMHPENTHIEVNNQTEDIRSLLGTDGVFYKVFAGSSIAFDSEASVQFSVYLHYRHNDRLMFRVGPYDISLDK